MKILISAGPMRTAIDPIRYVQNASSGVLGVELAAALKALDPQTDITMMLGPVDSEVTARAKQVSTVRPYLSPNDYETLLKSEFATCDVFISAAAVLDFEVIPAAHKIAREELEFQKTLSLQKRNVIDFSAWAGAHKTPQQKVFAFALSTESETAGLVTAKRKIKAKNADWIYLNFASATQGPGKSLSQGVVLDHEGNMRLQVPEMSKRDVAKSLASFLQSELQGDQP